MPPVLPIDPDPTRRITLAGMVRALEAIDPVFLNSPQYPCEPLNAALGCHVTLKAEFLNPIRSFKGRGASFLVHELQRQDPGDQRTIIAASAGNWGQAMAYACRAAGRPIILYASVNANALKVARMRALGAEVRLIGEDFDAAKTHAEAVAAAGGGVMVADGQNVEVSEAAGTIAIELLAGGAQYDAILVPLGNGALLNGMARWVKAASPSTAVIGVSAVGADAMEQSWRTGTLVRPARIDTIADGIGVRMPIPDAVTDMTGVVDDVLLVSDAAIVDAMRLAYQHAGLLIEPAGAAGLAAIHANRQQFSGQRVATVLCGSNLTEAQIQQWIVQP